jgi:hypothetical protein
MFPDSCGTMMPAEIFLASVILFLIVVLIWGRWRREP